MKEGMAVQGGDTCADQSPFSRLLPLPLPTQHLGADLHMENVLQLVFKGLPHVLRALAVAPDPGPEGQPTGLPGLELLTLGRLTGRLALGVLAIFREPPAPATGQVRKTKGSAVLLPTAAQGARGVVLIFSRAQAYQGPGRWCAWGLTADSERREGLTYRTWEADYDWLV